MIHQAALKLEKLFEGEVHMTIKQMKNLLGNYRTYIAQIKSIDRQINNLKCNDRVMASDQSFPFNSRPITIVGYNCNSLDYIKKLNAQKSSSIEVINIITDFIDCIVNPLTKAIFEKYYLLGRKTTWKCVSFEFGWHDEQCARLRHNKYLDELVKIGVLEIDNNNVKAA